MGPDSHPAIVLFCQTQFSSPCAWFRSAKPNSTTSALPSFCQANSTHLDFGFVLQKPVQPNSTQPFAFVLPSTHRCLGSFCQTTIMFGRQVLPFLFDRRIGRLAGVLLACECSQSVRRGWFDH